MIIRILLFVLSLIQVLYDALIRRIANKQRQKPLPLEVADIYEPERYKTFLSYKKDYQKVSLIEHIVGLCLTAFLLFSDFFVWMEKLGQGQVMMIFIVTVLLMAVMNEIISLPFHYYETFTIEENYGMNKKDHKEFIKDEALSFFLGLLIMLALGLPMIFICEHLGSWTHQFQISYLTSFLITLAITCLFGAIFILLQLISYLVFKTQYTFTDLEEGELRSAIEKMIEGAKKVSRIMVYNESKKSTSKNAFLLKLLWHKEFGIADNFLSENSQRELLAVLGHETGHLKHKKDLFDYLPWLAGLCFFAIVVYCIPHGATISALMAAITSSFNLHVSNYYVLVMVISGIASPLFFLFSLYMNSLSRRNEYEADAYSVSLGYGEDLIRTFKEISAKELMDVNPAPLIETLEFDHPGMYTRIKAIHKEIDKQKAAC